MASSSRDPLVAERKQIRLKVPATSTLVSRLPLTKENHQTNQTGKERQRNDKLARVERSVFIDPSETDP